jgi:phage shock protein A
MNLFRRLFKIGQAEAHAAIDQLEDPINMTEQGIRDMKQDLDQSLRALAEVKAMAIRARNEGENYQAKAREYEGKAVQLLQRAHKGDLNTAEADRLAAEALTRKEENTQRAAQSLQEQHKFEASVAQLDQSVKQLKATISKWENELRTLRSRVTVSKATITINKQLARIDSHSTVALLERMKEKIAVEEALAASYGEIAHENKSLDEEIDQALQAGSTQKASAEVAALKARLGLTPAPTEGTQP